MKGRRVGGGHCTGEVPESDGATGGTEVMYRHVSGNRAEVRGADLQRGADTTLCTVAQPGPDPAAPHPIPKYRISPLYVSTPKRKLPTSCSGIRNALRNREVFFFQAEAGIRNYKVTGVQTCALPIFDKLRVAPSTVEGRPRRLRLRRQDRHRFQHQTAARPARAPRRARGRQTAVHPRDRLTARSEERRVGKERRCRRTAAD